MGCLTDYIGIRWCGGTSSPPSSLYVNDLPGISLKQINSITDEENATFLSVWNNIQDRAERRFSLDVREAMSAKYRLKSLAQGVNLGKVFVDDGGGSQHILPTGAGIEIITDNNLDSQYTISPLLQINIQNVNYYCNELNNVGNILTLFILDIDTNIILFSKSCEILYEGWNTYEVNQSFTSTNTTPTPINLRVFFGTVDLDNVTELVDLPNNIQNSQCCGVLVRGWSGTDNISYTYGLSATFNVTCSWDGLICQNKNLFSRAFWYLCGIEFLTELIYSSVLTAWTTINLQKAKDLRAEYEVEYQKSLTQVASGMNLDCDCCLDCNGGVQLRTATQFF